MCENKKKLIKNTPLNQKRSSLLNKFNLQKKHILFII